MNTSEILVVGAGVFGATAALELRLQGHSVTLIDPGPLPLLVATGGSGHGFKFAPLIGAVISDKIEGKANPWKSRFRWRTQGERRTEAARME